MSTDPSDKKSPALTRRSLFAASAALYGTTVLGSKAFGSLGEKKPLADGAYKSLPLGSVKARGWLLDQLERQRDGLTGHAETVLPATHPDSAWKGGPGEDWEKGPYYLKGLIPLAYTLGDDTLKARAQAWIEPILGSQREDGFFGPKNDDWWPRMVVTYLLRDYFEATNDPRVLPFLTRYYGFMRQNLPKRPLQEWGKARAGDEIDTVMWLYERTGDASLLELTDLLAQQAYAWTEIFSENKFLEFGDDFHPKHNVNVPQAMKMPVVYSRRSGRKRDRDAYRAGLTHLMRDHGTSFGISAGTEMLSGRSTLAGVETCSIVEYMLSAETALRILGDARIGDELERVAFNGLTAAMTKDFRQHVYYTVSNNVAARRAGLGYYGQDYDDGRTPAPRSGFPCCCYNLHMGWPKLAQNAWGATHDGGLVAFAYVPTEVTAKVAGGQTARVVCETNYPFEATIRLEVKLDGEAKFPLHLRIPGWCAAPQIVVNGEVRTPKAGRFAVLNRTWKDGDRIELRFPMTAETVPHTNGWVSVQRGPLVYALGLKETWKPFEKRADGFDSYEVTTDSAWNYALLTNEPFEPISRTGHRYPFTTGGSPVGLQVKARRVSGWTNRPDGVISLDPPASPLPVEGPIETLTLVPFGSQMLRVSLFPTVGPAKVARKAWKEGFGEGWQERFLVVCGGHVTGNALRLPLSAKAVALHTEFGDVVYEGLVTVKTKGDAGLMFRVSEPSIGTDQYRGYYVGLDVDGGKVVLGKSDYAWMPLTSKPFALKRGVAYRVRVEAVGPRIRVWVDDAREPVLEFQDGSFTRGSFGVRTYSEDAAFRSLAAKAI